MKLAPSQQSRFWRDWSAICKARSWTGAEAERERHELLERAGFKSLTRVTRVDGFTAVLKELAALRDDLAGLMRAEANTRRVLLVSIQSAAPVEYWSAIARDKFGTDNLDHLSDTDLEKLRNTLAARGHSYQQNQRAQSEPDETSDQLALTDPGEPSEPLLISQETNPF